MTGSERPREDKIRALTALVLLSNSEAASRETGIPGSTIRSWVRDEAALLEELRQKLLPELEKRIVPELMQTARRAQQVANEYVELAAERKHKSEFPAKDALALMKTSDTAGRSVRMWTDRPQEVVEHRDYRTILAKYGGGVIEGDAEEITDAEVLDVVRDDEGHHKFQPRQLPEDTQPREDTPS